MLAASTCMQQLWQAALSCKHWAVMQHSNSSVDQCAPACKVGVMHAACQAEHAVLMSGECWQTGWPALLLPPSKLRGRRHAASAALAGGFGWGQAACSAACGQALRVSSRCWLCAPAAGGQCSVEPGLVRAACQAQQSGTRVWRLLAHRRAGGLATEQGTRQAARQGRACSLVGSGAGRLWRSLLQRNAPQQQVLAVCAAAASQSGAEPGLMRAACQAPARRRPRHRTGREAGRPPGQGVQRGGERGRPPAAQPAAARCASAAGAGCVRSCSKPERCGARTRACCMSGTACRRTGAQEASPPNRARGRPPARPGGAAWWGAGQAACSAACCSAMRVSSRCWLCAQLQQARAVLSQDSCVLHVKHVRHSMQAHRRAGGLATEQGARQAARQARGCSVVGSGAGRLQRSLLQRDARQQQVLAVCAAAASQSGAEPGLVRAACQAQHAGAPARRRPRHRTGREAGRPPGQGVQRGGERGRPPAAQPAAARCASAAGAGCVRSCSKPEWCGARTRACCMPGTACRRTGAQEASPPNRARGRPPARPGGAPWWGAGQAACSAACCSAMRVSSRCWLCAQLQQARAMWSQDSCVLHVKHVRHSMQALASGGCWRTWGRSVPKGSCGRPLAGLPAGSCEAGGRGTWGAACCSAMRVGSRCWLCAQLQQARAMWSQGSCVLHVRHVRHSMQALASGGCWRTWGRSLLKGSCGRPLAGLPAGSCEAGGRGTWGAACCSAMRVSSRCWL